MSTKHTPGPWITHKQGDGTAMLVASEEKDTFGRRLINIVRIPLISEASAANARLIAAAPEMLEALRNLLENYQDCFGKPDIERAEDAINKAEGK